MTVKLGHREYSPAFRVYARTHGVRGLAGLLALSQDMEPFADWCRERWAEWDVEQGLDPTTTVVHSLDQHREFDAWLMQR